MSVLFRTTNHSRVFLEFAFSLCLTLERMLMGVPGNSCTQMDEHLVKKKVDTECETVKTEYQGAYRVPGSVR